MNHKKRTISARPGLFPEPRIQDFVGHARSCPMKNKIYTIGYEGVTLDAFVGALKSARVEVLLDVRAVPLSRKPGFSKNKLAARLAEDGIDYIGLKDLGTPAAGRDAARRGHIKEMRSIFRRHMKTGAAESELEAAAQIARKRRACLLCFEHDPQCCHRMIVADMISELNKQKIEHIDPLPAGLAGTSFGTVTEK
jgi:uncharacterized protein (DUF488 family)